MFSDIFRCFTSSFGNFHGFVSVNLQEFDFRTARQGRGLQDDLHGRIFFRPQHGHVNHLSKKIDDYTLVN